MLAPAPCPYRYQKDILGAELEDIKGVLGEEAQGRQAAETNAAQLRAEVRGCPSVHMLHCPVHTGPDGQKQAACHLHYLASADNTGAQINDVPARPCVLLCMPICTVISIQKMVCRGTLSGIIPTKLLQMVFLPFHNVCHHSICPRLSYAEHLHRWMG